MRPGVLRTTWVVIDFENATKRGASCCSLRNLVDSINPQNVTLYNMNVNDYWPVDFRSFTFINSS